MLHQFLPVVAMLVTLMICLGARPIAQAFGVMAVPDGRRKLHGSATPQLGGVAILCGFGVWLAGSLIMDDGTDRSMFLAVLLAAGGLGIVGFIDDRHEIPPASRILMLLVFTGIAFTLDRQLVVPVLHWYSFDNVALPVWLYLALMALTAIGLVNSVNMADGQSGLVGSMFLVWTGCLAMVTSGELALMAGVLCALSLVFLAFNLRDRIFLGDCGSYGVTFVIGLMVTLAHARGQLPLETIIVWFFIPVMDCLRLMISRPLHGKSLFEGGRDHFHHRLIDSLGKRVSVAAYVGPVVVSSILATVAPRFSLVILCVLSGYYFSFAHLSDKAVGSDARPEDGGQDARNVVPMSGNQGRKH